MAGIRNIDRNEKTAANEATLKLEDAEKSGASVHTGEKHDEQMDHGNHDDRDHHGSSGEKTGSKGKRSPNTPKKKLRRKKKNRDTR